MTDESRGLRFNNKVAIVTGGCSGIGRGCVDVLAEHGGKIAVLDIDDDTGATLRTDARGEIFFIQCDTTKEDDVKKAVEATVDKFGQIDLLVNNAGWHPPHQTIEENTVEEFRKLLDLNVLGYFLMCKYALPHIRKTKGSVVNITSVSSIGEGEAVTYVTSKGGVVSMTRALAIDEAKYGVRVNAISPGTIETPLFRSFIDALPDKEKDEAITGYKHESLLRRLGKPKEIGMACLFLAVDATFSTGIDLSCTGGIEIGFGNKYD